MSSPKYRPNPLAPSARNTTNLNVLSVLRRLRAAEVAARTPCLPGVKAYRNAAATHTSTGNYQVVTWDAEEFDDEAGYNAGVNPTRLTVVTPGRYLITASVAFASNTTGVRYLAVRKNAAGAIGGGTSVAFVQLPVAIQAAVMTPVPVNAVVELAANDYVEAFAFQNSGANLAYNPGADRMFMSVQMLSVT